MKPEYKDFQTLWESRFLEVTTDHLGEGVELVEASRKAKLAGNTTLSVRVEQGVEDPHGSGWYECEVAATYEFEESTSAQEVTDTWAAIEAALGDGDNDEGATPLRDRLAAGRLILPGGTGSITYDGEIENEGNTKTLRFTAILGISALSATA